MSVSRPGTCHLVGCPGKGLPHASLDHPEPTASHPMPPPDTARPQPRLIGTPDTFEAYEHPVEPPARPRVLLDQEHAATLLDWISERQTKHLLDLPATAVHALSRGLAQARNTS